MINFMKLVGTVYKTRKRGDTVKDQAEIDALGLHESLDVDIFLKRNNFQHCSMIIFLVSIS